MGTNLAQLEESLKNARELGDAEAEARVLMDLGGHYQAIRRLPKAAAMLSQAVKLRNDAGPQEAAVLHARLGCVYWEMAQLKKALVQFEQALNRLADAPDAEGEYRLRTLAAITHWRKCQWLEGLAGFRSALKLRNDAGEETEAYRPLKEAVERGVGILQNRIRLAREQNDPLRLLQPLFSLAPLYLFTRRQNEMDALLKEAASLSESLGKHDILETIPKLRDLVSEIV